MHNHVTASAVSIVIPAYAVSNQIGRVLNSVLTEAFSDLDVIVNDGSDAVLAKLIIRTDDRCDDAITQIRRVLLVLDRFGRAHHLEREARTAVRVTMLALIDRLEIEQAKQRVVEGNFAAARYHLNAAHHRPWKVRAAQLALNLAPRLTRAAYLRLRPAF
jgi:glycosyltransferase involved in cell wall biosynthesis